MSLPRLCGPPTFRVERVLRNSQGRRASRSLAEP
ncbi:hypothetical protein STIAU_8434, partial [Stigmatella aurantiaca DW4/3-1]